MADADPVRAGRRHNIRLPVPDDEGVFPAAVPFDHHFPVLRKREGGNQLPIDRYFGDAARGQRMQKLETAVDFLRCKYGEDVVERGIQRMHSDLFETEDVRRRTHIENPFKGVAV